MNFERFPPHNDSTVAARLRVAHKRFADNAAELASLCDAITAESDALKAAHLRFRKLGEKCMVQWLIAIHTSRDVLRSAQPWWMAGSEATGAE